MTREEYNQRLQTLKENYEGDVKKNDRLIKDTQELIEKLNEKNSRLFEDDELSEEQRLKGIQELMDLHYRLRTLKLDREYLNFFHSLHRFKLFQAFAKTDRPELYVEGDKMVDQLFEGV